MENYIRNFISSNGGKITILFILLSHLGFSQDIDKSLKTEKWLVGKQIETYDIPMLRVKGDNNDNGVTNVGLEIDKKHPGFTLHLYVTRMNQHFVNLKNFTFVVNDSCGSEIVRDTLGFKYGVEIKNKDMYWNYGYISSTTNVRNVTIYLYDKINLDGNGEFIFQTIK